MLKFVYDRKIDDFFVPNCYPIKDNFYDDISSYIKETVKEPIVHRCLEISKKVSIDDAGKRLYISG